MATDPGGCWVAEDGDGIQSVRVLAEPRTPLVPSRLRGPSGYQGAGRWQGADGRRPRTRSWPSGPLLLHGAPGCARRYRLAGFSLHPQLRMVGVVDRSTLPTADGLQDGRADDFEWMDRLDQTLRGAGHGPGPRLPARRALRLVVRRTDRRPGYAYFDPTGDGRSLLAASDRETAAEIVVGSARLVIRNSLVNCITSRQRMGDRCRPGGTSRRRPGGLHRCPGHAAPGALPPQRPLSLTTVRKGRTAELGLSALNQVAVRATHTAYRDRQARCENQRLGGR